VDKSAPLLKNNKIDTVSVDTEVRTSEQTKPKHFNNERNPFDSRNPKSKNHGTLLGLSVKDLDPDLTKRTNLEHLLLAVVILVLCLRDAMLLELGGISFTWWSSTSTTTDRGKSASTL
jgi:hypothetical protein